MATVIPFIIGSVFADVEVNLDLDTCINNMPSDKTIHISVTNNAVETTILNQVSMHDNPFIYMSVDKGNKKGNRHLAKFLC